MAHITVFPARPFALLILLALSIALQAQPTKAEWQFASQRPEIAPEHALDNRVKFDNQPTLMLKGAGKHYAAGHWYKEVAAEAGRFYTFKTHFLASAVEEPDRCVLARVIWLDGSGKVAGFKEYPATREGSTAEGWRIIEQTYQAPPGTQKARLELHLRWDGDAVVYFGGTSLQEVAEPKPRLVRLATIHHRPRNSPSTEANLKSFASLVDRAGAQKADIVCLPEGATLIGTRHDYVSASEPVPGPTTRYLGEVAKRNNLYIVAGLLEREGEVVYNTSVLIDRKGNLVGKYRKTSLPREEIDGGITPGTSFPVFDTDFGRIGMMICWDVFFPEPARALAQQGAEVIFLPIWGGDLTLTRARAIENQVYVVSSTYDMISAVFDQEGKVLKEAEQDGEVVVVEVDLNKQKLWPWLGDFKNRIPREMPSRKAIASYQ